MDGKWVRPWAPSIVEYEGGSQRVFESYVAKNPCLQTPHSSVRLSSAPSWLLNTDDLYRSYQTLNVA